MHSWPHAPARRGPTEGTFILTAGTFEKAHLFSGEERLKLLQAELFRSAHETDLELEAWAIFANHYHLIGRGRDGAFDISSFARKLHGRTSVALNRLDAHAGRKVWFNFWDTKLTHSRSYYARLHYVHTNPVRHGVVANARDYPFCSAHWFETQAEDTFVKMVYGFKTDLLQIQDDF